MPSSILRLVHTSEISTSTSKSTSTNARHTHAQKWFGSWITDSARAYAYESEREGSGTGTVKRHFSKWRLKYNMESC